MTDQERESLTNEGIAAEIQMGGDRHGELLLELMQKNKGFAYLKAKPFIKSGLVSEDELPTISFFATSRAVQYWNSSKGAFLTVLNMFLTDELMRCANESRVSPLPQHMQEKVLRFKRWEAVFFDKYKREPNRREILRDYGISDAELSALERAISMQSAASLDVPLSDDEGSGNLGDFIADDTAEFTGNVLEAVFVLQLRAELAEIIDELPDSERKAIVQQFYGSGKGNCSALNKGLARLRKPSIAARLAPFLSENLYLFTGLSYYRRTQTSQPERLVISHYNEKIREGVG